MHEHTHDRVGTCMDTHGSVHVWTHIVVGVHVWTHDRGGTCIDNHLIEGVHVWTHMVVGVHLWTHTW